MKTLDCERKKKIDELKLCCGEIVEQSKGLGFSLDSRGFRWSQGW